jgi:nitrogenase molybdenum-iron protein alpha/beta subunit
VLTSCLIELTGEEVEPVARRFAPDQPRLVVRRAGMSALSHGGALEVTRALIDWMEPHPSARRRVNLIDLMLLGSWKT